MNPPTDVPDAEAIERQIAMWHRIAPPNEAARRQSAQLAEIIAAYAALRAEPALQDAPGDFATMLSALRDRMAQP